MSTGHRHVPALDGVRAFAVVAVVLFHVLPSMLPGGWVGVDVFFVLSGFLITRLLLAESVATGSIRLGWFYRRRWLRLMPALVVTVLFATLVELTVAPVRGYTLDALASITYLFDVRIVGLDHGTPVSHTWSLAVEEQFYIVWPPLLAWGLRRRFHARHIAAAGVAVSVAVCVGWLLLDGPSALTFTPLGHADELMIGCLAATIRPRKVPTLVAAGGVAVVAAVAVTAHGGRWEFEGGLVVIACLIAAVLLHISSTDESVLTRTLSIRPLVWLGKRSYGIYLYHFPMIWLVNNASLGHGTRRPLIIVATLVLAELSYRFVEQPFLARKKRYEPPRDDDLSPASSHGTPAVSLAATSQ